MESLGLNDTKNYTNKAYLLVAGSTIFFVSIILLYPGPIFDFTGTILSAIVDFFKFIFSIFTGNKEKLTPRPKPSVLPTTVTSTTTTTTKNKIPIPKAPTPIITQKPIEDTNEMLMKP
jgi:hypothetical protein